jgi:hypothetical protein
MKQEPPAWRLLQPIMLRLNQHLPEPRHRGGLCAEEVRGWLSTISAGDTCFYFRSMRDLSLMNSNRACILHSAYYNFCRVHKRMRITPTMESELIDHV